MSNIKNFKKVLIANRGEIAIRVIRACRELGIRTVAIYSHEDRNSLFRTKANESYEIGRGKSPIDAYLDIEEIIHLAKSKGCDAIHPGYGFLSENPEFARACINAGIEFIGPDPEMMAKMGDKIASKHIAKELGVPIIPGSESAISEIEEAERIAKEIGYPIIIKAAAGGGGRGMRVARNSKELETQFTNAVMEARKAFGNGTVFVEKYIEKPKHIEVQVLGDKYGNLVHLFERDCSLQRRHQKVVEFTPAISLSEDERQEICYDAARLARGCSYSSAGTIEFLVDDQGKHYFIEMNTRIQVEHTVTELVTGIDIVQSQILIAEGYALNSTEIGISGQHDIHSNGYAIQCRVTTEDPANDFAPDIGTIIEYRSASGNGIRLDGGNGFTGSEITPYYDSLLVKVCAHGRTFDDMLNKALRALHEMKVEGVKTNIGYLVNLLNHPVFRTGKCDTAFISEHPELLNIKYADDAPAKLLEFLGNKFVNETRGEIPSFDIANPPRIDEEAIQGLSGTKQIFDANGAKGLVEWITIQNKLLLTDTTLRDAQQSLLATRLRTKDMEKIAPAMALYGMDMFSYEMWGGATFDVAMRYLGENPWERLRILKTKIPNVLMQMLIRGSNAVGYTNYPDNVIRKFIKESAEAGIDVFRIFDALNWTEGIEVAMDEVLAQGKVAEPAICYTGDILDESRDKYNLDYYVKLAKKLEKMGAHIIAIKDMAGLLKPKAASKLIKALKGEVTVPIALHTHDTSGNGIASILMAADEGLDIADAAFNSFAGLTSQPGLNSIVAALSNSDRDTGMEVSELQQISDYFETLRPVYQNYESGLKTSTAEIYRLEIPGGQYSNLRPQVESFGIGYRFDEVKEMFVKVNEMLGDIIKVTPTSKVVGDLAIFMVQNGLTPDNIYDKGESIDFPDSVVSYFLGMMGQPEGGFPKKLQKLVLKNRKPLTVRPGKTLHDVDFDKIKNHLIKELGLEGNGQEQVSYAMYNKVFDDYITKIQTQGNFKNMESDVFFHGLSLGNTKEIELIPGKAMMITLDQVSKPDEAGNRELSFTVNGSRRVIRIKDNQVLTKSVSGTEVQYANIDKAQEIGANIPGTIIKLLCKKGDKIKQGDAIAIIEAMKMETNVISTQNGIIERLFVKEGDTVKAGQLIACIEDEE